MRAFALSAVLLPFLVSLSDGEPALTLYRQFEGINVPVRSVALSPNGEFIAAAGQNSVMIWQIAANRLPYTFQNCETDGKSISFSRDGRYLAASTGQQYVTVWTVNKPTEIYYPPVAEWVRSTAVAFSSQTDLLAVGSANTPAKGILSDDFRAVGTLELWRTSDFARFHTRPNMQNPNTWSIHQFRQVGAVSQYLDGVSHLAISNDGTHLMMTNPYEISLFRVPDGASLDTMGPLNPGLRVRASISHRGDLLAFSATTDEVPTQFKGTFKNIYIWDTQQKKPRGILKLDSGVVDLAFIGSTAFLASVDDSGTLTAWDCRSLQRLAGLKATSSTPQCLAVSADGSKAAVATAKGDVVVVTLAMSEDPRSIPSTQVIDHDDPIWRRVLSGRDHRLLAAELQSIGVQVTITMTSEGRCWLNFVNQRVGLNHSDKFETFAKSRHLRELNLFSINSTLLQQIVYFKNLEVLRIVDMSGPSTLSELLSLSKLQSLLLSCATIRDDDLLIISQLDKLTDLSLVGDGCTDDGLLQLCSLNSLRKVRIASETITENGIIRLAECAKLEHLEVMTPRISNSTATRLRKLIPELVLPQVIW